MNVREFKKIDWVALKRRAGCYDIKVFQLWIIKKRDGNNGY